MLSKLNTIILSIIVISVLTASFCCSKTYSKGQIAFDYETPSKSDLIFLSKFNIVVSGEILNKNSIDELKKNKVKLVYYEWLPADYFCKNDSDLWHDTVLNNLDEWVIDSNLNDKNPMGKKYDCKDYFFSFSNSFIDARIDHLIKTLKENDYDGLFFDWASGFSTFEEKDYRFLKQEFEKKYPNLDYDKQILKFLKKLKDKGVLIVLNRGFHSKNAVFDKYADFDVAESVFTTDDDEIYSTVFVENIGLKTVYETSFESPDNAVRYAEDFLKKSQKANKNIKFLFLNYALPYYQKTTKTVEFKGKTYHIYRPAKDKQAFFYAQALAYLVDGVNFISGSDVSLDFAKNNLYTLDMGRSTDKYKVLHIGSKKAYIRYFTKGFVVVANDNTTVAVDTKEHKKVYNLYNKKEIACKHGKLILTLKSKKYFKNKTQPVGMIYLWKK